MLSVGFLLLGRLSSSSGGVALMLAALVIGTGNGMSSGIISMMGKATTISLASGIWVAFSKSASDIFVDRR